LLRQAAIAVSAGAAGFILLILVGTQILDWQWPVLLFAAVFALGFYRVTRRILPSYSVAQMLDRSLGLQDRLSTVFYFRRLAPSAPQPVDVVEREALERVHAEDVDRAMPLVFPRSGYTAAALALAAVGLFGVRYMMTRTLDLQKPLARITFDTFRTPPKVEASSKKSVIQEHLEKQLQQLGLSTQDLQEAEKTPTAPSPMNVDAVADEPGAEQQQGTPGKGPNPGSEGAEDSKSEQDTAGKPTGETKDEAGSETSSSEKGKPNPSASPKAAPKNGNNTNPGVIDKMKDALANLLNKLGANPPQKSEESASNEGQQQGGKQQASQKGTQGQGKSQGESQQTPDPQGGQDADAGDKSASQQQRASQQDGNKGDENAKSGMGKSDGDKTIQDAEQLAAMGKISEIFGKRAAEIKGEMSVEVPSGNQQLKTGYSQSSATHSGAITESNRNEIPLMYQTYVQRYFEEVRKSAAAKAKTATP
jgi:hypothetical protein